ncbi:MAG: dTDP-4-dehydrorhamnose 3,5-epimerase [Candidatus Paceibacterota bacterium]
MITKFNQSIGDVVLVESSKYEDDRGFLSEVFNEMEYEKAIGKSISIKQLNTSCSKKGVIRGIHYAVNNPQGKLVQVLSGAVYDVAVDLRANSPTFSKWCAAFLMNDTDACRLLWIPPGFGHAFMALADNTIIQYLMTEVYEKDNDRTILYNDPTINIRWPTFFVDKVVVSEKDKNGKRLTEAEVYG